MMQLLRLPLLLVVFFMLCLQGCAQTRIQTQDDTQVDPLSRLEIFDELGRPMELTRKTDPSFRVMILEELSMDTSIAQEPRQIILDELRRARKEVENQKNSR